MHRASAAAVVAATLAVAQLLAAAGPVLAAAPATTLSGTITLEGCVLRPNGIRLVAQPVGMGASGGRVDVRPDPKGARTARLAATPDPHVLRYSITELKARSLYHLAIRDVASLRGEDFPACGTLFWQGPFAGLAVPGAGSVPIRGYAVRTQLEAYRPSTRSWVGADRFDPLTREGAVRQFRWRSNLTGITSGELQISTEPFPTVGEQGTGCDEPPAGIVYRQQVEVGRARSWADIGSVDIRSILTSVTDRAPGGDGGATSQGLRARSVALGAPLWIRVVPQRAGAPACDLRDEGVAGWVELLKAAARALGDSEPVDPVLTLATGNMYTAPFFDPKHKPSASGSAFMVVKQHTIAKSCAGASFFADPLGCQMVFLGVYALGHTLVPGDYFWIEPGSGDWWSELTDTLGSLVTGAIDAIGFLVDQAAKAYAAIKQAVKNAVTSVVMKLPGIAQACGALPSDACGKAISLGLEAGMAAVGLPPELPDFSQLKQMGVEYVASELASQAGIPQGVVDAGLPIAQAALDRIEADRGGPGVYGWAGPFYGYVPAAETVVLHKTGGDLPPNLVLERQGSNLYAPGVASIPTRWVSDTLRIPMALDPNVDGIPAPVCHDWTGVITIPCGASFKAVWYRERFRSAVAGQGCVAVNVRSRTIVGWAAYGPPPKNLDVSTWSLVDPLVSMTWDGKYAGTCSP